MTSPAVAASDLWARPESEPGTRRAARRQRLAATSLSAPARSTAARVVAFGVLLMLWAASIGGTIAQTLTMSRAQAAEGLTSVYTQAVVDAGHIALLLPAAAAVFVLIFRVVFVQSDVSPLVLVVLPWVWIVFNEFARGGDVTEQMLLPIGVAVTLWAIQPRVSDLRAYALAAAGLAVVSMVLTSSAPALMYMPQTFDANSEKSLTGLPLLAGFFGHPNGYGMFLVLALPLTHLFSRWYLRWTTAAVLLAAILWSASRTALFGVAVWAVVLLVSMLLGRAGNRTVGRVFGALLLVLVVAVVALPLITTDPEAFTKRGAIWRFALSQLSGDQWLVGLGHSWYVDHYDLLKAALSSAASHGHNVFVTYVVTGGIVLVALLAVVLAAAARAAGHLPRRDQVAAGTFLCVLTAVSITETAWRVEAPDTLFAAMVVPLFVIALQARDLSPLARRTGDRTGETPAFTTLTHRTA